ncbi:hypothetical protein [Paracoccus alkanivorans]|nr:hypothetical protein [Paracoccus alkanivorans]
MRFIVTGAMVLTSVFKLTGALRASRDMIRGLASGRGDADRNAIDYVDRIQQRGGPTCITGS